MYFIKKIQGNMCTVGDLYEGESDMNLTKQEVLAEVNRGTVIYGVVGVKFKDMQELCGVGVKFKDIQELAIELLYTKGFPAKRGKQGNILIKSGCSLGFYEETWTNDGFLHVNVWDVRNARKILGC